MILKKLHIIINPVSGQEEPILSFISTAFHDTGIEWEVSVTKQEGDATEIASRWISKVDVIAIYGGDGSVTEVARALHGSDTPLFIIPGGTANVLSKELGIPQDSNEAIRLLASGNWTVKRIDAAMANDELFLIRINFGIMANMVLQASRELKDKVGQLAYGITAIKTLIRSERNSFQLVIDETEMRKEGVALTVTNCGSIGIGNYAFLPDIRTDDGRLDVILMHNANLLSVLRIAGSTLFQTDSEILEHWTCKEVEIHLGQKQAYILDDCERSAEVVRIKTLPGALPIIVPLIVPL